MNLVQQKKWLASNEFNSIAAVQECNKSEINIQARNKILN
jgi:hypothetical protein